MSGLSALAAVGLAATLVQAPPAVHEPDPDPAPAFQRISSADGLSSNSVYAIAEDPRGFIWLGTVDGLNRFDGQEFRVHRYDPDDPRSLPSNVVMRLLVDAAGRLWVGTERGLARLEEVDRFRRYPIGEAAENGAVGQDYLVHDIHQGRDAVWVATSDGLYRYDPAGDRLVRRPYGGAAGPVAAVRQTAPGSLWVLTGPPTRVGASLDRVDLTTGAVQRYAVDPELGLLRTFHIEGPDRVWLNGARPGRLDTERSRYVAPEGPVPAPWRIYDAGDVVWIGSEDGIHRWSRATERSTRFPIDPDQPTWLHNYVRGIAMDRSGALWVGTYAGVYRSDPNIKPFEVLRHDLDDPGTLSASAVSAFAEEPDGTLWIATFGGGVNRLDPEGGVRHYREADGSLAGDVVWTLYRDGRGTLWAGTEVGLAAYDPARDRFIGHRLPPPPGAPAGVQPAVAAVAESRGRLWFATFSGLYSLELDSGAARRHEDALEGGSEVFAINAVMVDAERGALWFGIEGGTLGRLDLETGRVDHHRLVDHTGAPLPSEGVWDIERDAHGALWVASGAGLSRFEPETGRFRHFLVKDGLPGSAVYSIVADGEGRLWLGTNGGLSRFRPTDGRPSFRNYHISDGIAGSEFNRSAAFRTRDGALLFGGVDGLTRFHPAEIRDNPHAPPVVLTAVEVAGRDGVRSPAPDTLGRLVVRPEEHTVSIEFAALSYTDPDRNRYAYRLDGFDDDWIQAGTRRFARYTTLPPGDYVFRVRGSNNDGVWNEAGASLAVTVLPPFWATPWFRLLVLAAIAGLLLAAHRYRVRRLLEVERLRLRIARDLHDDLGSDLSGIALAADMVGRRSALEGEARRRLDEVRDTALAKVEVLRDIVWYIDPQHDTLEATIRRMRAVADRLLEGRHTFQVDPALAGREIDMARRRDLFLVYKELLHNALRHSGARRVAIRLAIHDGALRLSVEDDGVGFDPHGVRAAGRGLANLRARAAEMGGTLRIDSAPGRGTTVSLEVEMARTRHGVRGGDAPPW